MQVKLSKRGPAMWFLGEPRKIKYSLNFAEPGPIKVDFGKLEIEEQRKLLIDLYNKVIETDSSLEELRETYNNNQSTKLAKEQPAAVKEYLDKQKAIKKVAREIGDKEKKRKEGDKFNERCDYLSKKSLRVIKATTQNEADIKFVRALLSREEEKKKPRGSVCDYLKERVRKLQQDLIIRLNSEGEETQVPLEKDQFNFDVHDEDQKVISFVIDNSKENETMIGEEIK